MLDHPNGGPFQRRIDQARAQQTKAPKHKRRRRRASEHQESREQQAEDSDDTVVDESRTELPAPPFLETGTSMLDREEGENEQNHDVLQR